MSNEQFILDIQAQVKAIKMNVTGLEGLCLRMYPSLLSQISSLETNIANYLDNESASSDSDMPALVPLEPDIFCDMPALVPLTHDEFDEFWDMPALESNDDYDCPCCVDAQPHGSKAKPEVKPEAQIHPKLNYNHRFWPSPRAKNIANHLNANVRSHKDALRFLANRANLTLEALLEMNPLIYADKYTNMPIGLDFKIKQELAQDLPKGYTLKRSSIFEY
jgi:hypothetical protein